MIPQHQRLLEDRKKADTMIANPPKFQVNTGRDFADYRRLLEAFGHTRDGPDVGRFLLLRHSFDKLLDQYDPQHPGVRAMRAWLEVFDDESC